MGIVKGSTCSPVFAALKANIAQSNNLIQTLIADVSLSSRIHRSAGRQSHQRPSAVLRSVAAASSWQLSHQTVRAVGYCIEVF